MASSITTCPDEAELVHLAQAGDNRAFTWLVALYEPTLRAQVARFRLSWADAQDLSQEGLLGLLSAVHTYHPERGAAFRTYAAVCVRNRLISAVRRRTRVDEVPMEQLDYARESASLYRRDAADPALLLTEQEEEHALLDRVHALLSAREYAVLLRYLNGFGYEEIAAALGISPKAVDNALTRARRKLRQITQ